jgi:hypothetical protein
MTCKVSIARPEISFKGILTIAGRLTDRLMIPKHSTQVPFCSKVERTNFPDDVAL